MASKQSAFILAYKMCTTGPNWLQPMYKKHHIQVHTNYLQLTLTSVTT